MRGTLERKAGKRTEKSKKRKIEEQQHCKESHADPAVPFGNKLIFQKHPDCYKHLRDDE